MTQLTFLEVPVWDTGLVLVLLSNGTLAIERGMTFVPFYDLSQDGEGAEGVFMMDAFSLKDKLGEPQQYDYGVSYPYKTMPLLKAWLIQQKLEM